MPEMDVCRKCAWHFYYRNPNKNVLEERCFNWDGFHHFFRTLNSCRAFEKETKIDKNEEKRLEESILCHCRTMCFNAVENKFCLECSHNKDLKTVEENHFVPYDYVE